MALIRSEAATIVGYLTFICVMLLGDLLTPASAGWQASAGLLVGLFFVMFWLAFAVVRHAESLATLLGEPYGTLILTLSVIGIEVALISSIMITGSNKPTLARETMFSVVMIVLNGLVGLTLVIGGMRHRFQHYNLQGANAYLAVLIPLAALSLILPRYSTSAPGGELSQLHAAFLIGMSVILYGVFLGVQTITHSDIFRQPVADMAGVGEASHDHHGFTVRTVPYHCIALLLAMLPIVLLSKNLAIYVDYGIEKLGAPLALGGFLIAALVLSCSNNQLGDERTCRIGAEQLGYRLVVGDPRRQPRDVRERSNKHTPGHSSPGAVCGLCDADFRHACLVHRISRDRLYVSRVRDVATSSSEAKR
jgi:Ca2+:H+ antiporter